MVRLVHGARAMPPHETPLLFVVALAGLLGCGADAGTSTSNLAEARPVQVELKLTLRAEHVDLAREQLELHDDDAEERDIFFFDTPQLELFDQGVILRARNIHEDDDDSTIKIRPLAAKKVAASWFGLAGFKC